MSEFRFCLWLPFQVERLDVRWLAEIGIYGIMGPTEVLTATFADLLHSYGLRVFPQWPEWERLGLSGPAEAFRNHLGLMAANEVGPLGSPSYWHPFANELASLLLDDLEASRPDGLLIIPRYSDNPFPKHWERVDEDNFLNNAQFYSFDQWAVADWARHSDEPMPTHASVTLDNSLGTSHDFYRWYQGAWQRRIEELTAAALAAGHRELYTWYAPLPALTCENIALGSYNSAWVYDKWVRQVTNQGGHPTILATCLFASWLPMRSTAIAMTLDLVEKHGWDMMAGAEICNSTDGVLIGLLNNGFFGKRNGLSLFGSGRYFFDPVNRRPLTELVRRLVDAE